MSSRSDLMPSNLGGRIAKFIEESGEANKALGKYLRFGPEAIDPKTNIKYNNTEDLIRELNDLRESCDMLLSVI